MHLAFELPKESWHDYFEDVTKNLPVSEVVIELISEDLGDQIEAEWLPLRFLEYDYKSGVFEVAVGGHDERYPVILRHLIHHPSKVWVDADEGVLPTSVLVEDPEGVQTLIRIRPAPALPPGRD